MIYFIKFNNRNYKNAFHQTPDFPQFTLYCVQIWTCLWERSLYSMVQVEKVWTSGLVSRCEAAAWRIPDYDPTDVSAQVCGSKQLGCHAENQELSRCCIRGESEGLVAHRQQSMQASSPGQMSPEVQKMGISSPTKRTDVPQTVLQKV